LSQVVIRFKQEGKYYCLRYINSLIVFGIRKNCLINGRTAINFIKHFNEYPLKVKSVQRNHRKPMIQLGGGYCITFS
jgi:hypothetical protein